MSLESKNENECYCVITHCVNPKPSKAKRIPYMYKISITTIVYDSNETEVKCEIVGQFSGKYFGGTSEDPPEMPELHILEVRTPTENLSYDNFVNQFKITQDVQDDIENDFYMQSDYEYVDFNDNDLDNYADDYYKELY